MLTNKWIQFAISLVMTLLASLVVYPWTTLVDAHTAGIITGALGLLKMVLNAIAPASGTTVIPNTSGNPLVSHVTSPTSS